MVEQLHLCATPPGSPIEAYYIENFRGFSGDCLPPSPLPPVSILAQPTNQTVNVGDTVVMSVLSSNFCEHQ